MCPCPAAGRWFHWSPGLLKPEAALLRGMQADSELGVEAWKLAALPPPRGNHAEYLWSEPKSRKAADYQAPAARRLPAVLTPGFSESRVTGNHWLLFWVKG